MELECNWRESSPRNLLIARRLSVDYTLLISSISEKRPRSYDTGVALLRYVVSSYGNAVLVSDVRSFRFAVPAVARECTSELVILFRGARRLWGTAGGARRLDIQHMDQLGSF